MESAVRAAAELVEASQPLLCHAALPACATTIYEGAQGILLDEWRGFHPHTTWSTITLESALSLIEESEVEKLCVLGVTRAYPPRHGVGPFPTSLPDLDAALTDPGNPTTPWQGTLRRGWLDLVLLRYAVEVSGASLHGLVIDHLDELIRIPPNICMAYRRPSGERIERLPVAFGPSLLFQSSLTELLNEAEPICELMSESALPNFLAEHIADIAVTAIGPTWLNRTIHALRFDRITTDGITHLAANLNIANAKDNGP
jgi:adenylosuccinate synthase